MISKAQEKRNKQLRSSLTFKLNAKLVDFKNTYLGDYADFRELEIKRVIKKAQNILDTPGRIEEINNERRENSRNPKYVHLLTVQELEGRIKQSERRLSIRNINQLNWLTEAKENYETKLTKVIDKLVSFEMNAPRLNIESIGEGTSRDFEFLITNEEMTVHARVIYACGAINAPHYRFIVTKRE